MYKRQGSGRGKGVMQLAAILPAAIQEYYDELNRKDKREYRQKLLKWNLEERLAAQEKSCLLYTSRCV